MPENLDQAIRLADLMANGDLIPDHLKGKPGNCLLIVSQAMHWQMSPFAVAQCTYFYKGHLGYEGKLVNAAVEALDVITDDGFDDVYEGEGRQRKLTLTATKRGQSKPRSISVDFEASHTTDKEGNVNQQWRKDADQMLYYAAVRKWVRRYSPSVLLGVYTRQEIDQPDIVEHDGLTIDATAEEMVEQAVAKAADDVAARAAAEAAKPTVHTYQFTSLKAARSHSKAADWISDWTKLLEGYVAAAQATNSYDDMRDRVQTVWKMNKGSLEAVVGFDYPSHQTVMDLIGFTLKALTPPPPAQVEKKVEDAPGGDITVAGAESEAGTAVKVPHFTVGEIDRSPAAIAEAEQIIAAACQAIPQDNESPPKEHEPASQQNTNGSGEKAAADQVAAEYAERKAKAAHEDVAKATWFVDGLEKTLRSCVEEAVGGHISHSVAGGRASLEINNRAVQSKLARLKREGMHALYTRVLEACSDLIIVGPVLSGSQDSYEAFHYDLVEITERKNAA